MFIIGIYQNIVSLSLSGEKDTGSAGMQPASDNLTDWNGHGGLKSPYYCLTIPRNYGLENPATTLLKKEKEHQVLTRKKVNVFWDKTTCAMPTERVKRNLKNL
jgi:hypothetical protein